MFLYGNKRLGIQYSLVEPCASPFNVWFEGAIVYFCWNMSSAIGSIEDLVTAKAGGQLARLLGEGEGE